MDGGLAPNTEYDIRVKAHGDCHWLALVWGPDSWEKVMTDDTPTPTPEPPEEPPPAPNPNPPPPPVGCGAVPTQLAQLTNVTVIPLPEREAKLQWDSVCHADQYVVLVRKKQGGTGGWDAHPLADLAKPTSDVSITIDLDDVDGKGNGLADDPHAYQFHIKARDSKSMSSESPASEVVTIVDSPIVSINGDSLGSGGMFGKMLIKWRSAGSNAQYTVRWREITGNHTQRGWQPTAAASDGTGAAKPQLH